jgi:hypothetical protein
MLKLPKDLFRNSVVTVSNDENNDIISQNLIGYVAKDTDEVIVVFSEFNGNLRFDIPKSIISVAGNLVIIDSSETLSKYKINREDPLPQGKSLRLSAEEITGTVTTGIEPERMKVEINNQGSERVELKKHYKTPVQAPILPTTEMTETYSAQFEKKGEESFVPASQQRVENRGETAVQTVKTEDVKGKESQPPKYQAEVPLVRNLELTESIHEKEKDTGIETNKVSSTKTTSSLLEETVIQTENKTKSQSELSQDKPISLVAVQSVPAYSERVEKEEVTPPRIDQESVNEFDPNTEKPGLDMKEDQRQELPFSDSGVKKEALDSNTEKFEIPFRDYPSPFGLGISLWQDFAQAGIQMYNGFVREFSKINEYWLDIYWNAWSESSDSTKKVNKYSPE